LNILWVGFRKIEEAGIFAVNERREWRREKKIPTGEIGKEGALVAI
jgi:hypothetical protein